MAVLALTAVLVVALLYVTIPLTGVLTQAFGESADRIVWVGSAFGFAYAAGNLVFGTLSDRFRRRTIMSVGLLALCAASAAVAMSPTLGWLIALRALQGFLAASFPPVALAYVGDVLPARQRPVAISVISSGFLLAGIAGQLYAGAVASWLGWSGVFALLAAGYLAAAYLVHRLPAGAEPQAGAALPQVLGRMAGLLASPALLAVYGAAISLLLSFVAMYSGLGPYAAAKFGLHEQGLMLIRLAGVPAILLSPLAARLIPRYGAARVLILGLAFAALGAGLEAVPGPLPLLVAASAVFVAGIAAAVPGIIVLVGQLSPEARGSAVALYGFFIFVGASLGPLLTSALKPYGFPALGAALAGVLLLAASLASLAARAARPKAAAAAAS